MVRVRFAPSPTGFLHVGGARTALFNYLFARKENGKFILRIEDTDIERSREDYEKKLIDALRWLGIDWDEGPDVGGDHGPYRQSERINIYHEVAEYLVKKEKAYYVYAYPEEIEKIREQLLKEKKAPHYTEEMFEEFNTPERRKEYESKGLKPAVFFKMPRKDFILNDIVKGEVIFKEGSIGDFVLLRSNGLPTYNFACVVDDSLMEITHVIRGDDHLSNTLRQLAIYEALQKKPPKFAHVSMILGPDGKKLSKRFGATSVEEFRDKGYLPQALANYLVLLGWSHPEGKEILSKEEMIEAFSLDRLSKNPAIFDPAKLRWMNAYYIRSLETEELVKISKPFLEKIGYQADKKYIAEILDMVKDRLEVLEELPCLVEYFFKDPEPTPIHGDLMKRTFEKLLEELEKIDWEKNNIVEAFKKTVKDMKIKAKDFYMTLRIILTGREEGPELVRLVPALGKEKVIKRLKKSLEVSL